MPVHSPGQPHERKNKANDIWLPLCYTPSSFCSFILDAQKSAYPHSNRGTSAVSTKHVRILGEIGTYFTVGLALVGALFSSIAQADQANRDLIRAIR